MNSNYYEHCETSHDTHRNKRRKLDDTASTSTTTTDHHRSSSNSNNNNNKQLRWKTTAEQQTYSSKLLHALRHVRLHRHAPPSRVRAAADTALALSAKGRSRWSRAILLSRRRNNHRKHHRKVAIRSVVSPPPTKNAAAFAAVNAVEKRVKVLSRIVPGCRKVSLPNLLEETSDYIAALQMQVRAMSALALLLSGSATSEPERSSSSHVDDGSVH